jgi:two-component system, cell cycle sensor histidine kinase and response regulator CckA
MGGSAVTNKSVNILMVEDSPTQAVQLKHHLEEHGYDVTVARNGREALVRASERIPAMVITDVVMPEMDGYALCKSIKSLPHLRDVPVILLTSLSGPQDVLQGLECGADNFIRKPYEPKYLLSRIEYILANLELRKTERMQVGVQLLFGGRKYFITAEKQQILDLLISTYEGAIQINAELAAKQQELTRERDLLHILMDNVPDWIYFKDTKSRFTAINRSKLLALGLSNEQQALGKTDFDFFAEAYARAAFDAEQEILRTGQPRVARVEHVQWANGASAWLSSTKMLIRDVTGKAIGTFGVSRDITQARLAEEQIRKANEELELRVAERTSQLQEANQRLELELAERIRAQQTERETQARFRFLFANNPLPMWVHDRQSGAFLEVNGAAIAHYGYSAEEFGAMRISDILLANVCDRAPDLDGMTSGEWRHRLKNGSIIDVEITSHELEWVGHQAALVVAHDITERKRLQREFMMAQKMEAVGRLAAGIAHDFNNLLTIIGGYSDVVLNSLEEDSPIADDVREISRAGERAASLTRQLLAFSKRQILQAQVLDVNRIVADMDRMLRRLIGEDVELVTVLDPHLGTIKADPGQVEQVIMNLVVNARDAMPKGGKLTIETKNIDLHETVTQRHLNNLPPGAYVNVTVTDTGTGMDRETQARIFDPFFTTKGEAGTGLGLATVYGIVQQSSGAILVYSEIDHGTSFKIFLPRVHETTAKLEPAPSPHVSRGSETILVVEDEDAVRTLICSILEKRGYAVLRARNGEEALSRSDAHAGQINMMITDVVMPSMNGSDLAAQLAVVRPDMKVLLMSGYTDNAIVRHGVLSRNMAFLGKPFAPEELVRKVREILDGREV